MRQLTALCLALSGLCISAFPDTALSAAKPTTAGQGNVSVVALRSQPDQPPPAAPKPGAGAPANSSNAPAAGADKGDTSQPSASAADKADTSQPSASEADKADTSQPSASEADKADTSQPPASDAGKADTSQPSAPAPASTAASTQHPAREEFCTLLMSAAEKHTLPIGFFVNLIWQESRFVRTAVSSAGALGVAQFMPAVAESMGLRNPFDPRQALPASARLLRTLHEQFGNLGLAAAAYNAGPKRVLDWLAKRGRLPRETRNYVLTITGRPAEHWMTNPPPSIAFQVPPRVPCFQVEAFAAVVKPADGPPPRESAPPVRLAEASAVKILPPKMARDGFSPYLKDAYKKARLKPAFAKRYEPASPVLGASKLAKEAARSAWQAAKRKDAKQAAKDALSPKEAANPKPVKEAAKAGRVKAASKAKLATEPQKASREATKPTREAALRTPSKASQR